MVQSYVYRSPTTPGGAGWSVDLGNQAVRLSNIGGITQEAELGAVGTSSISIDDPTGTAGHSSDAIVGLKQFDWDESACPAGKRRIWTGYIGDRRYRRGTSGESPSLMQGVARVIDITLVDINSFLAFRVFQPESLDATSSFNRPAETDLARITALLATDFLSTTIFGGLVSTTGAVDMDAVDYTGQRPADVVNDCAQQSGKNFFVIYDEAGTYGTAGKFVLFYDFNDAAVYTSTLRVSNVAADVDNALTWYPLMDAELVRDPSRVMSGVLMQSGTVAVYENDLTTSYTYGYRDAVGSAQNLKTAPQMTIRANRYLSENSTEDDRLSLTLKLPAANVNDWMPGQAAQVKFQHLPGYESFRYVRALTRTVMANEGTDKLYNVRYECTPTVAAPSGAYGFYESGSAHYAVPILISPTTPGALLVVLVSAGGLASARPETPTFGDDPTGPTYSDPGVSSAWTLADFKTASDPAQYAGPGSPVGFGIWWRRVNVGETTLTPVLVRPPDAHKAIGAWLYEIKGTPDPGASTSFTSDTPGPGYIADPGTVTVGSALSGIIIGGFAVQEADYAGGAATTVITGTELTSAQTTNDPATHANPGDGNIRPPWVWLGTHDGGGPLSATLIHTPGLGDGLYNHFAVCGVALEIPNARRVPTIPYPANQVEG